MLSLTILGSTGSIGQSTLEVVRLHPNKYRVFALTANSSWKALFEQCIQFSPEFAVLNDEQSAGELRKALKQAGVSTEVLSGVEAQSQVAGSPDVDIVMAAIVGAAGLLPTLAAVNNAKKVLLANKEVLVMAGSIFTQAVQRSGAELLPIDSEHNAIFQCLPPGYRSAEAAGVRKILLTASGGPFLNTPQEAFSGITPEQACAHPNWSMGQKISVDSATLMNKGLEFIEACWLFDLKAEQIDVVVHPQSIIHSMVQYIDGSVLAQLGNPDMRTPIAHALAWPERLESGVADLDIIAAAQFDFVAPDLQRFPCLRLAQEAITVGKTAPVVLNAANEIAVDAFLHKRLRFDQIADVIAHSLDAIPLAEPNALDVVQEFDLVARECARNYIEEFKN